MGVLLARQGRLLREYARQYLGEGATDDEVESAIERTVDTLLESESVIHEHALRHATQQLWHECHRAIQDRGKGPDVLVDRRVGPLNEQARRILERLGPRSREAILRAAQGWTPEQQAEADHTSVGTINIRLHRARRRFLQLKSEMGSSASALGGLLLNKAFRIRVRAGRHVSAAGTHGLAIPLIVGAAVVPMVAATLWPANSHPRQPAVSRMSVANPTLPGAATRQPAAIAAVGETARQPAPVASATLARSAVTDRGSPLNGLGQLLPKMTDLQLTTVATLPGVEGRVIVAIAEGSSFSSRLLMQSLDGGITWTATSGPPATVTQLALPPNYPQDPRIFGGVDALGSAAPYEATAFGQPFKQLAGLPPGRVAVSAHFDDGDPRLFSAAATGVWSVDVDIAPAPPPHEEIDYAPGFALQSVVATLATPPTSSHGIALLVWAPAASTVPGTVGQPSLDAPVVACPVNGSCATESFLPTAPGGLTVAGTSVVAYSGNDAFISADDGSSFRELPLPATSKVIFSMTFVGPVDEIWLSTTTTDAHAAVYRHTAIGWQDESTGDGLPSARPGTLAAAAPNDVLDVLPDAGYRCTSAATIDWLPRCPS